MQKMGRYFLMYSDLDLDWWEWRKNCYNSREGRKIEIHRSCKALYAAAGVKVFGKNEILLELHSGVEEDEYHARTRILHPHLAFFCINIICIVDDEKSLQIRWKNIFKSAVEFLLSCLKTRCMQIFNITKKQT